MPGGYCCLDHALCNVDEAVQGHDEARKAVEFLGRLVDDELIDRFCGERVGPGGCQVIA